MRYWEIDFSRGLAVILMLIYHFFFDARYFGKIEFGGLYWYLFPRVIASMFIFISGLSVGISCSGRRCLPRVLRRSLKLGSLALMITLASYLLIGEGYVIFGILHFLALAPLVSLPLFNHRRAILLTSLLIFILHPFISELRVDSNILLWLGITPENFYTLDYFPLIPWLGVFLSGVLFSHFFKPVGELRFPLRDEICWLGRNSLMIYLIQHPLLVLLLHLIYGDVLDLDFSEVF